VWRGGKIDHPAGEHDDYANAAAGVTRELTRALYPVSQPNDTVVRAQREWPFPWPLEGAEMEAWLAERERLWNQRGHPGAPKVVTDWDPYDESRQ
jgi:hypothetical protein